MNICDKPIMPKGFLCFGKHCGLKKDGQKDLAVFLSESRASAAAVFTKNQFPGIPVILGREIIKHGYLRAIVANSKISNVGTGKNGLENARIMAKSVAEEFQIPVEEVIMCSTGIIAKQLPVDLIVKGIKGASNSLTEIHCSARKVL